jgi:hypothetical protein|tara:strand:- start:19 stop:1143 length:1125 start_codon:yes stop_codon:yes gene_type:complete
MMVQEQARLMLLYVLLSLTVVSQLHAETNSEDVGAVDKAVGWRQIIRDLDKIEPNQGQDVISKDDLRTGEGRLQVRFQDDSKLRMTEHTRIVIDNVVFDDDPSKSDLAMTFAQGTARFISGGLGKVDKENIRLKTPTASIGIRGTDFTVTVDEFGKTLVVLLPDVNGISSGEIIVSTMTGEVVLNKPFESTTTTVAETAPSAPAILDLTLDMLNNIMIISPPKTVQTQEEFMANVNADKNINPLDIDFLDEDMLESADLEEDLLEFTELDINYLDVDLLEDMLDNFDTLGEEVLQEKQSSGEINLQGTEEGFDTVTQVATVIEGDKVTFNRTVNDIAVITVDKNALTSISIEQDGKELDPIRVNGVESEIIIKQ